MLNNACDNKMQVNLTVTQQTYAYKLPYADHTCLDMPSLVNQSHLLVGFYSRILARICIPQQGMQACFPSRYAGLYSRAVEFILFTKVLP